MPRRRACSMRPVVRCSPTQAGLGFPCDDPIGRELVRLRRGPFSSDSGRVTLALGLRGPQYSSLDCTLVRRDARARTGLARQRAWRLGGLGAQPPDRAHAPARPARRAHDGDPLQHPRGRRAGDDGRLRLLGLDQPRCGNPDGLRLAGHGALLAAGIRPSLSIDDCAAIGGDMFGTMHTALIVQRGLDNAELTNPTDQTGLRLRCRDVVEFATLEGARACGFAGRVGSLAPGKEADIILLRIDDPTFFPVNHALGSLVAAGHPGLVDTVLVAGEVVKRSGRLVGVDLDRLRAMLLESRERSWRVRTPTRCTPAACSWAAAGIPRWKASRPTPSIPANERRHACRRAHPGPGRYGAGRPGAGGARTNGCVGPRELHRGDRAHRSAGGAVGMRGDRRDRPDRHARPHRHPPALVADAAARAGRGPHGAGVPPRIARKGGSRTTSPRTSTRPRWRERWRRSSAASPPSSIGRTS